MRALTFMRAVAISMIASIPFGNVVPVRAVQIVPMAELNKSPWHKAIVIDDESPNVNISIIGTATNAVFVKISSALMKRAVRSAISGTETRAVNRGAE